MFTTLIENTTAGQAGSVFTAKDTYRPTARARRHRRRTERYGRTSIAA
jgi:hypothetical protein